MSETRLGKRFWISMLVFGLMGQIAWVVENMYFNVFIYKMFHATAAEISAMVMAKMFSVTSSGGTSPFSMPSRPAARQTASVR